MANAVTIQLATVGASKVIGDLGRVASSAEGLHERVSQAQTAFVSLGGGVTAFAAAAVASYESMERLKRVLSATLGESVGTQLAAQIRTVAEAASSSGSMLRQFAMNWVGMVKDGETSVVRMMKALDKMGGGLNAEERQRVSFQLAQVGALPTLQWEDLKEILGAGLPLQRVADRLGAASVRDLAGMDSQRFLQAFMEHAESLPAQAQLLTTRVANVFEGAMSGMAATGAEISKQLDPLATAAEDAVKWFKVMNSDGRLGFNVLKVGLAGTAYALGAYVRAVWRATFALERLAVGASAASVGGGVGAGAAGAAGRTQNVIYGAGAAAASAYAGGQIGGVMGGQQGEMLGTLIGLAIGPTIAQWIAKGVASIWGNAAIQGAVYTAFGRIATALGGSKMAYSIALALAPAAPLLAAAAAAAVGYAIGRAIHAGLDAVARTGGYSDTGDWVNSTFNGGKSATEMAGRPANAADARKYGYSESDAQRLEEILKRQAIKRVANRALKRSDWQNYSANAGAAAAGAF